MRVDRPPRQTRQIPEQADEPTPTETDDGGAEQPVTPVSPEREDGNNSKATSLRITVEAPTAVVTDEASDVDGQTTPKASASATIPSLSLLPVEPEVPIDRQGPQPAVSAGLVAGNNLSSLMPPPPRPSPQRRIPSLSPLPNQLSTAPFSGQQRLPVPNRGPQAQAPATSTLAPPPTHSSRPTPPRRPVTLEAGHSPLDWARLSSDPTKNLSGLPPGTTYVRVAPSQLKAQNGRKGHDAWMVLGGMVYNVTPYLPFHPGGVGELMRGAGKDGSRLFGEVHPWVNYEGMLSSCLVGALVEEGQGYGQKLGEQSEMDEVD